MTDKLDVIVVGAGIVGLAIARAFVLSGRSVIVLEKNPEIGMETSSRNSEVVHAGIYYPPGSLKAKLCVEGKRELYLYCKERGVAHSRCGKMIVAASEEQSSVLYKICENARLNGVEDLTFLSCHDIRAIEPEVIGVSGLFSPSTGVIDSHGYMLSLQGDLENAGGSIAFETLVHRIDIAGNGLVLRFEDGYSVGVSLLINAAGLGAQGIASRVAGLSPQYIPPLHLAKGNYFSLTGVSPFRHLVYPVPVGGGLGIHATIDLAGKVRFGPDVQWIDDVDYSVDPERSQAFYSAIRQYWPNLRDDQLVPDYAGIRPKVERPGGSSTDFFIRGPESHGVPGLVNLFGIESPGLTASLALANHVVRQYAV